MHRIGFHTSICWWLILIHSNEDSSLWSVWVKIREIMWETPKWFKNSRKVDEIFPFNSFLIVFDFYFLSVVITCEACCKMFVLKWASHCNIKNKILPQQEIWDKDICRPFQKRREDVGTSFVGPHAAKEQNRMSLRMLCLLILSPDTVFSSSFLFVIGEFEV